MALAEKLHHSAQKVVEDGQFKRGEEYKKNALYEALRGQKTPLPRTRTVSTALVPQVVLPDLGGEGSRRYFGRLPRAPNSFGEGGGEEEGEGEGEGAGADEKTIFSQAA